MFSAKNVTLSLFFHNLKQLVKNGLESQFFAQFPVFLWQKEGKVAEFVRRFHFRISGGVLERVLSSTLVKCQWAIEPTIACFPISCKSPVTRALECSIRIRAVRIRRAIVSLRYTLINVCKEEVKNKRLDIMWNYNLQKQSKQRLRGRQLQCVVTPIYIKRDKYRSFIPITDIMLNITYRKRGSPNWKGNLPGC